jgi:hypothetical protein
MKKKLIIIERDKDLGSSYKIIVDGTNDFRVVGLYESNLNLNHYEETFTVLCDDGAYACFVASISTGSHSLWSRNIC